MPKRSIAIAAIPIRPVICRNLYEIRSKVNYANLKAQCYYTLADYVHNHRLKVAVDDTSIRDTIIADLEQMKAKGTDKDSKLLVLTKEEVKEEYGRSPDFGDALMMRMWFKLYATPTPGIR